MINVLREHVIVILIVLSLLVVLLGLLEFAAPHVAAEALVEVVKQSPEEDVYAEVARKLAEDRLFFVCGNVALGMAMLLCAWSIPRRLK